MISDINRRWLWPDTKTKVDIRTVIRNKTIRSTASDSQCIINTRSRKVDSIVINYHQLIDGGDINRWIQRGTGFVFPSSTVIKRHYINLKCSPALSFRYLTPELDRFKGYYCIFISQNVVVVGIEKMPRTLHVILDLLILTVIFRLWSACVEFWRYFEEHS